MAAYCISVRRHRIEDDLETDSYDLRERLEVSRLPKRDRKIWKAGIKLVGLLEPQWLDRGVSFRHLHNSCESQWPRLFGIKSEMVSMQSTDVNSLAASRC